MREIRAITIRQPHVFSIIYQGKDIENRDWATKHRGEIFIHASNYKPSVDEIFYIMAHRWPKGLPMIQPQDTEKFVFGALVAVAELVDCVEEHESPWFVGKFGFVLKKIKAISPIKMKGGLGIWKRKVNVK